MSIKKAFYLSIFSILYFCACESTEETHSERKNSLVAEADSFKFIFGNFTEKDLDSIYVTASDALTERGFKVDKVLEKIGKKDTNAYEYYAIYAFRLAKNNRPKGALECLNVGSKYVKPKDRSRHYFHKALMWGYLEPLHHRDSVYKYLKLAIDYDSLNPFWRAARSQFYLEDDLYTDAIDDINKCLELSPGDTDYVNVRGWYKMCSKDIIGALKDLKVLSNANKKNANVYMHRAICYNELKMYKESLREANICIKLNPDLSKAYIMRANAKFHYLKDKQGAMEDSKKAAELGDEEAIKFVKDNEAYFKTHTNL